MKIILKSYQSYTPTYSPYGEIYRWFLNQDFEISIWKFDYNQDNRGDIFNKILAAWSITDNKTFSISSFKMK